MLTYIDNVVWVDALAIDRLKGSLARRLIETEQTGDKAAHEQTRHDDHHIEQIAFTES